MKDKEDINFGESLKEILHNKNIKIKDLASALNISQSTAYSWISNTTEPNLSFLIMLADYLECSIDFLIGKSENENFIEIKSYPPLTRRIREVMKEVGISSYKLGKISKYDGGYFYKWEHGSEPLLSTLIELSKILDCTIDYLIGRV